MLAFATDTLPSVQVYEPEGGVWTNALLECFAVHVRCLDGFLWGQRGRGKPLDALASDFCDEGAWRRERPKRPPALVDVEERKRMGREIVHLSYERSGVPADQKDWPVGQITRDTLNALLVLADRALPGRLDDKTRDELRRLPERLGSATTAYADTAATQTIYRGGTIPFQGFTEGS